MKFALSHRVSYISIFIISIFAALYWWQIQVSRVRELENQTETIADIENSFKQIDELTLKLHNAVSVQEIQSLNSIDEKAKNDLIQFRETYLHAYIVSSKISAIKQYLVVVRQIQKDMKVNKNPCLDHVCMSYAQYMNTFIVYLDRYEASKNMMITKQTSPVFKKHLHEAFDLN